MLICRLRIDIQTVLKRTIELSTTIEEYDSIAELTAEEQKLLEMACDTAGDAYAPYSGFEVGAALLLENGEIILGNNQENVAYPSGLCAERVAIYAAGANYPNVKVKMIAVTAQSKNFEVGSPVPPCGACRQAMCEYENKAESDIRLIMGGRTGKVQVVESVRSLLPLVFVREELRRH